jgi:hypothetical protein
VSTPLPPISANEETRRYIVTIKRGAGFLAPQWVLSLKIDCKDAPPIQHERLNRRYASSGDCATSLRHLLREIESHAETQPT